MSKPVPPSKLHRHFVNQSLAPGVTVTLALPGDATGQHEGDLVGLFNGRDGEWRARLMECAGTVCTADVEVKLRAQEAEPDLWLCFAPITKSGTDFIVEKATELGVSVLVPVATANTNVELTDPTPYLELATWTAEQCERLSVPKVRPCQDLEALLADWPADRHIMFCDEEATVASAHQALSEVAGDGPPGPWAVLTGPEAGFDAAERNLLRDHLMAVPVSLGRRTLKADTAAVAALAIWQSALGIFTD